MDVLCGRVVSCCSLFWTMWMEGWTGTDVKRALTSNDVMLYVFLYVTNGHLCMFNQALYPVEHTSWCIYALFINDKEQHCA